MTHARSSVVCPHCGAVLAIDERTPETSQCSDCDAELIIERIGEKARFVPHASRLSREEIEQRDEDRETQRLQAEDRRRRRAQGLEDIAKMIFAALVLLALLVQCTAPPQRGSDSDYCPGPDRYC